MPAGVLFCFLFFFIQASETEGVKRSVNVIQLCRLAIEICAFLSCSWGTQYAVLLKRSLLAQLRNPTDTTARLLLSTWVGMLAGAPSLSNPDYKAGQTFDIHACAHAVDDIIHSREIELDCWKMPHLACMSACKHMGYPTSWSCLVIGSAGVVPSLFQTCNLSTATVEEDNGWCRADVLQHPGGSERVLQAHGSHLLHHAAF